MRQPKSKKAVNNTDSAKKMAEILEQWEKERPDLDCSIMAVCGEVWRSSDRLRRGVLQNLENYDLDFPSFDVMLTLRRQGKNQSLSPSEMAKELMLSTSAMTNRLDRLEARGLIERSNDPSDRRGLKIALTKEGYKLADSIVDSHVRTEEKLMANLSKAEQTKLLELLSKVAV